MTATELRTFWICYSGRDIAWAEWIAHVLEEAGHATIIEAWDFRGGQNFVLEMQRASEVADHTIIVLSPRFRDTPFTQPEWAAAFASDPAGRSRRLIPVRVEECDLSGLLAQVIYIDIAGLTEDQAVAKLLTGVLPDRAKPTGRPPFPGRI